METNSKEYWDHRFDTDWIDRLGQQQSAFFAKIALGAFPEWLVIEIRTKKMSLCDWGCALGDGTNEISHFFPDNALTGIDFSGSAIAKAKEFYPHIDFFSDDLLEPHHPNKYKFDLFFSSNTIEHFAEPWNILLRLSGYAGRHLVILIPYKEYKRYPEHLYTFDEKTIPAKIGSSFRMTHMEIIDGASFTPNYWGELQVLLIYSATDAILEGNLKTLSDTEIRITEGLYEQKEMVKELKRFKESMDAQLQISTSGHEKEIERYKGILAEKEALIQISFAEKEALIQRSLAEKEALIQRSLAEKEELIHGVQQQLSGLKLLEARLEAQGAHLAEKDLALAELKRELDTRTQSQKDLAQTIQELNQTIVDFQINISKLQNEIDLHKRTFEESDLWQLLKLKLRKRSLLKE